MVKNGCRKPDQHATLHLCSLRGKKLGPEIEKLFSDPRFVCAKCGIRVNRAENVCDPKPF